MSRFSDSATRKLQQMKKRAARQKGTMEEREFETHYYHDARQTLESVGPSIHRSHSKTERGARDAAIAKMDQERYNKAVIVSKFTGLLVVEFCRDAATGSIKVNDSKYRRLMGERTPVIMPGTRVRVAASNLKKAA